MHQRCELIDISFVWETAGSDASARILPRRCLAAVAPGSGVAVITDDTSAGIDASATAKTVVWGTLAARRLREFCIGDSLALDFGGTLTALVKVVVTATYKRI